MYWLIRRPRRCRDSYQFGSGLGHAGGLELARWYPAQTDLVLGVEGVTSRLRDLLPNKRVVRLHDGDALSDPPPADDLTVVQQLDRMLERRSPSW